MNNDNSSSRPSSNPFATYAPINPFLVQAEPAREEPSERRQSWGAYSLPETLDDEVLPTDQEGQSLEILITWGSSVLHVAHLTPPRTFVVGEADGPESVDFVLPASVLGRSSLPLIFVNESGVHAMIPEQATGNLRKDQSKTDLRDLFLLGAPVQIPGAHAITLGDKARLTAKLGEVTFNVRLVQKSAPVERGLSANWDWAVPSYFGVTAAAIGAFMGTLAFFVPPIGLADEDALDKERLVLISQYLDAASEREQKQEELPESETGASESGETGTQAKGPEGEAGKEDAPRVNKRVAVKGPSDNPRLELSRLEAISQARDFGMIGILSASSATDPLAPTFHLGGDRTLGSDDLSANGNLWGDEIGESGGNGGLGLMGNGFGGGDLFGNGLGIGLGRVGTIGPGLGKEGWGHSNALSNKSYKPKGAPKVRSPGETITSGRLPREVIQRVVRQNFGRFRMCYQEALGRNPTLEGRIPVRFVIGRDGAVSNVSAGGDMPDAGVRSCVQSAFYGISFPQPDNGIVTVTYPLMFSPE